MFSKNALDHAGRQAGRQGFCHIFHQVGDFPLLFNEHYYYNTISAKYSRWKTSTKRIFMGNFLALFVEQIDFVHIFIQCSNMLHFLSNCAPFLSKIFNLLSASFILSQSFYTHVPRVHIVLNTVSSCSTLF